MKGVIFNLLEDFVSETFGNDAFEEILAACPSQGEKVYAGPGTYPDEELFEIVRTACERHGLAPTDALRGFGRFAFPRLASRFPIFLEGHADPKSFLLSVDGVVHVEVRKLFKDSVLPSFEYHGREEDGLTIRYRSSRKLCHFMEGLLDGTSDWFGKPIRHRQSKCMHAGHDSCEFLIEFPGAASQGSPEK